MAHSGQNEADVPLDLATGPNLPGHSGNDGKGGCIESCVGTFVHLFDDGKCRHGNKRLHHVDVLIGPDSNVEVVMTNKVPFAITASKKSAIELDKRQYVPFIVTAACPKCHNVLKCDLSHGQHYLSYPVLDQPCKIYFNCTDEDDNDCCEFQVEVIPRLTLEAV